MRLTIQLPTSTDGPGALGAPHLSEVGAVQALRHVLAAGVQYTQAVAARFGLGDSEALALTHLRLSGDISPHELAERTGLSAPAVTALLDRLQKAGLAQRRRHPRDRRRSIVSLSEQGHRVLIDSDARLAAALRQAVPELDEASLVDLLLRLAGGLTGQADRLTEQGKQ